MVKTPKLVYVLILFLSICFSITISNSSFGRIVYWNCKTDKDCKQHRGFNFRCRSGNCIPIRR
ncbi:Nodule Cysteine-Rich (NCR) secreted peptide [Medicago truncatula]|uniref:Nodule Cysteine-Rich (NCR) secreted peptide n=2 Tax=Medicago truncatula TaxID=3880 RepID=A0A072TFL3_MEDTR|nr:Nodule Cysteine-Rich (NCR) secreted peptide [Medicago truncatula]